MCLCDTAVTQAQGMSHIETASCTREWELCSVFTETNCWAAVDSRLAVKCIK